MDFHAHYFDGQSARRRQVGIVLGARGLTIQEPGGAELAYWPYEDLRSADEAGRERELRVGCSSAEGARLVVPPGEARAALVARAPAVVRPPALVSGLKGLAMIAAGVVGTLLIGVLVFYGLPRASGYAASLVPVSWEEALGEKAYRQSLELLGHLSDEEPRVCDDPSGLVALEAMVGELTAESESPYRYRVSVLSIEMTNAFALPGGHIVFFDGLIREAESADEVAGVLAHEMGHVVHQDGTKGIFNQLGLSLLVGLMFGDLGGGDLGGIGETLFRLAYSRDAEHAADVYARDLLERTGIGTRGVARFFARQGEIESRLPEIFQLLSSHPSHEAREQLFSGGPAEGRPAIDAQSWQALREICDSDE